MSDLVPSSPPGRRGPSRGASGRERPGEIFRSLGVLIEPPSAAHFRLAPLLELDEPPEDTEYTDLLGFQLFPWASVYLGAEGKIGGEARDRIAGFWRALEVEAPAEPDHLSTMLAGYAELLDRVEESSAEAREGWERARDVFLHEHLISWLPLWLAKLTMLGSRFYRRWAGLARVLLKEAAERVPGMPLSAHLRGAAGLPDPRLIGGEVFLESLLVPVQSGLVVVRDDLVRAARDLGLGGRIGERRWALRALFSQDAAGILEWLGAEAAAWDERHQEIWPTAELEEFWRGRAARAAMLLRELAREAGGAAR